MPEFVLWHLFVPKGVNFNSSEVFYRDDYDADVDADAGNAVDNAPLERRHGI